MHDWSDKEIDWKGISDAASFMADYLTKWGRVPVRDHKEKYGTVRLYCSFGWSSVMDLTHPGYAWVPYKRDGLMWKLCYSRSLMPFLFNLLSYVVRPYHIYLYRRAYKLAIKKWPHLREEILRGADWCEYLEEFGWHRVRTSQNGYELHLDWHPDHYSTKHPEPEEDEV